MTSAFSTCVLGAVTLTFPCALPRRGALPTLRSRSQQSKHLQLAADVIRAQRVLASMADALVPQVYSGILKVYELVHTARVTSKQFDERLRNLLPCSIGRCEVK
jgi:hypothetical protein